MKKWEKESKEGTAMIGSVVERRSFRVDINQELK